MDDRDRKESDALLGVTLGGFRLDAPLGRGGMGAVYRANQLSLDRTVAVKVLLPELTATPQNVERFRREIRTLGSLTHPNIVSIIDGGYDPARNVYYYAMELVDGVTLRNVLDEGGLSATQALHLVPELCDALEYAHSRGVLHRDVKPSNILLDREGRVKIADFGLSRLVEDREGSTRITGTHQVMGTVEYMAPEQREGAKNIDHRADIYSLGVVFYEMLTGELPIGRFALPSHRIRVDVRLDDVVLRVLEKDPERRYQRASAVAVDVRQLESDADARRPTPAPVGARGGAGEAGTRVGRPRTSGWAAASLTLALLFWAVTILGMAALLFLGRPA